MTRIGAMTLVATVAAGSLAGAQERLTIHLAAGTARQVTAQENRDLEAKFRAAQKAFEEVQKPLKKQHGKDIDTWPEAAQEQFRAARDTMAQAETDWLYSGIKQKDVDDSLRDVSEKLGEKQTLKLVGSEAEADLTVTLIGRGKVMRDLGWGGAEGAAEVAMRVAPGGRLDGAALARSGASFRAKKSAWTRAGAFTIHEFSADAPYWLLVSRKPQVGFSLSWKGAAGQAADAFERFAAEHATAIASARQPAK
jgi:hypothetical protein